MIRLRGEGAPAHVMEFVGCRHEAHPFQRTALRSARLNSGIGDGAPSPRNRVICLLKALNAIPARAEQRNNTVRTAEMTRTRDNGGSFPGFYLGFDASDPLCIPAVE